MNKYLNIFHEGNDKECFLVDEINPNKTRKLEIGETIKAILNNQEEPTEVVLDFDGEKREFFLRKGEEKHYKVQGTLVE